MAAVLISMPNCCAWNHLRLKCRVMVPIRKSLPQANAISPLTASRLWGNYAVRLTFSDGHDTGLFTWEILYRYGREQDQMMQDYLARLETMGLSREG